MRKTALFLLLFSGLFPVTGHAVSMPRSTPSTEPIPSWRQMKLNTLRDLSSREWLRAGKELRWKDRVALLFLRRDIRRAVKRNPDMTMGEYVANRNNRVLLVVLLILAALCIGVMILILRELRPAG